MKRLKYLFEIFIVDLFKEIKTHIKGIIRVKPSKCNFCKKYRRRYENYPFGNKESIILNHQTAIIWNKEAVEKAKDNQMIYMCGYCYREYRKFLYPDEKLPDDVEVGA